MRSVARCIPPRRPESHDAARAGQDAPVRKAMIVDNSSRVSRRPSIVCRYLQGSRRRNKPQIVNSTTLTATERGTQQREGGERPSSSLSTQIESNPRPKTALPRHADDVRPCDRWTAVSVNSHNPAERTELGQGSGTIRRGGGWLLVVPRGLASPVSATATTTTSTTILLAHADNDVADDERRGAGPQPWSMDDIQPANPPHRAKTPVCRLVDCHLKVDAGEISYLAWRAQRCRPRFGRWNPPDPQFDLNVAIQTGCSIGEIHLDRDVLPSGPENPDRMARPEEQDGYRTRSPPGRTVAFSQWDGKDATQAGRLLTTLCIRRENVGLGRRRVGYLTSWSSPDEKGSSRDNTAEKKAFGTSRPRAAGHHTASRERGGGGKKEIRGDFDDIPLVPLWNLDAFPLDPPLPNPADRRLQSPSPTTIVKGREGGASDLLHSLLS
ncbi:hypothetical protein CMUS01_08192 [Colletotrichum musicola]|uniref:Uncharacterized protein n=1 Tax=Colletotrichum musicola TaxID=2175873 RepID=A0A8H6KD36_9PEZI|nr:hypothetical protein CMUS01_08192 [Colletotrichum musicola]